LSSGKQCTHKLPLKSNSMELLVQLILLF